MTRSAALGVLFLSLPMPMRLAGAESTITLTDWTGRGFVDDVVSYRYAGKGSQASLRLTDPDGKSIPVQLDQEDGKPVVRFVAHLPANKTLAYRLSDAGGGAAPTSPVAVASEGKNLVLRGGKAAVRLPARGRQAFSKPVAWKDLPAPIQGFTRGGGTWLGGGKMLGDLTVSALTVDIVAQGPVRASARYQVTFSSGGSYEALISVDQGLPLIRVEETYDLKQDGVPVSWDLDLTNGWSPKQIETASVNRNGQGDAGATMPIGQFGVTPEPITSRWAINPDNSWGPRTYFGLLGQNPQEIAGFIPLRKGFWRRYVAPEIRTKDSATFAIRLPVGVRPATWTIEGTSRPSPFSIAQHDPAMSLTRGSRAWGILTGSSGDTFKLDGQPTGPFGSARMWYGCPSLDRYKDYVLEWPDTKAAYPRVFMRRDNVPAIKAAVAKSPSPAVLNQSWTISGSDDKAKQNLGRLQKSLDEWLGYITHHSNPGHGTGGIGSLVMLDDLLGWPRLSAEKRRELRAKTALVVYLGLEPDIMAWHAGTHMGTPNMPTGAYGTLPCWMALLPDHPAISAWRDWAGAWFAFSIGKHIDPAGGWMEYGSYGIHGYKNLNRGLYGLQAMGAAEWPELARYNSSFWRAMVANLGPADPRYRARTMPGMANSPPYYPGEFIDAVGILALAKDDAGAAMVRSAWEAGGSDLHLEGQDPVTQLSSGAINLMLDRPDLKPVGFPAQSQQFPAVGAFFRSNAGVQENYLFLRGGHAWSHWNPCQGNLVFYASGYPLVPGQPFQYDGSLKPQQPKGFAYMFDNCVRFGHPDNQEDYAWADANMLDATLTPVADYGWVSVGYPDWWVKPGRAPKWGGGKPTVMLANGVTAPAEGGFTHDRQVVMVKGRAASDPTYVVFRDSMTGPGVLPSWWNINLFGRKESIKQEGSVLHCDTPWPVKLDVIFADGGPLALEMAEDEPHSDAQYFPFSEAWNRLWKDGEKLPSFWLNKEGKPAGEKKGEYPWRSKDIFEQHVLLRIPGAAGREFHWLLWPRVQGSKVPVVTRPVPGLVKIVHATGTDYVFLSATATSAKADGYSFSGQAGIITVRGGKAEFQGLGSGSQVGAAAVSTDPGKTGDPAGYTKTQTDAGTQYEVVSALPNQVNVDGVSIFASSAKVIVGKDSVRFIAGNDGYVKLTAGEHGVRGLGPFDLTINGSTVSGTVEGKQRSLVHTLPRTIIKAMYHMDGIRFLSGIADEPSWEAWRQQKTPQFSHSFGVTAGKHRIVVAEWTNPGVPPAPPRHNAP